MSDFYSTIWNCGHLIRSKFSGNKDLTSLYNGINPQDCLVSTGRMNPMDKMLKTRIAAGGLIVLISGLLLLSQPSAALSSTREDGASKPTYMPTQTAPPPPTPTPYCPESYIELSVDKSKVRVGEHFILSAIYHNLGQPWVYSVGLNPQGLAVVDPPFDPPCKNCSDFRIKAVSVSRLEIGLCATGEIYCNGWMWSGACSKTPVYVQIDPAKIYLPILLH